MQIQLTCPQAAAVTRQQPAAMSATGGEAPCLGFSVSPGFFLSLPCRFPAGLSSGPGTRRSLEGNVQSGGQQKRLRGVREVEVSLAVPVGVGDC
jgi:hypothetical protein